MPPPALWTTTPPEDEDAAPTGPTPIMAGPSGDVIEGPVMIHDAEAEAAAATRADLEHLMALREADFRQHAAGDGDGHAERNAFPETQPAKL